MNWSLDELITKHLPARCRFVLSVVGCKFVFVNRRLMWLNSIKMKILNRAVAFACMLGLLNPAAASLITFPLNDFSSESFGSPNLTIQPSSNLSAAFLSSGWEQFAPNFGQSRVLSIPEQMRVEGTRRVSENLQRYVDQFPNEILIAWSECFETSEDREQRVNAVSSQWTSPDPLAALEWIRVLSERDELPAALNRALQASEGVPVDWNSSFVQYGDFSSQGGLVTVVPEPSAYALILGLMSCAVIVVRRMT